MNESAQTKSQRKFVSLSDTKTDDAPALLDAISEALLEKKAEDITLLDVRNLTTLTDYFIVCHAGSDVQIKAIADNVMEQTREKVGEKAWKKEGLETRRWVVLDYVNVVVHIFLRQQREFYGIERMWNDAEITKIEDAADLPN